MIANLAALAGLACLVAAAFLLGLVPGLAAAGVALLVVAFANGDEQ